MVDIACMSINELDAEAWSWLILPKKLSSIVLVLLVLLDVAVFDKNTLFLRKIQVAITLKVYNRLSSFFYTTFIISMAISNKILVPFERR